MRATEWTRIGQHLRNARVSRDEAGQVLPFVVIWILLALLLLSVVVAVGQAVNRRSGLQLLADAGAYTGASTMAVGLNGLAKINRELITLWDRMKPAFSDGAPCAVSDRMLPIYLGLAADLGRAYEQLNRRWQAHPRGEAGRVTTFNLFDLFPGEPHAAFRLAETDQRLGLARQRDTDVLVASTRVRDPPGRPREWMCTIWPAPPQPRAWAFDYHYKNAERGVRTFTWVVTAPAGVALLARGVLGADAVPPMKAVAAAKPVGGSIEEGRPTYITKMVPLATVGLTAVSDGGRRGRRPITH